MLNNNVQTAARDIRVQTHIIATILHHHNLAKIYMSGYKGTHQQSVEHKISPLHTVKEAPLSSSERLSIIVAALGALKQQHPFINNLVTDHSAKCSLYSMSKQPNTICLPHKANALQQLSSIVQTSMPRMPI
jgi:hypothetical protein